MVSFKACGHGVDDLACTHVREVTNSLLGRRD